MDLPHIVSMSGASPQDYEAYAAVLPLPADNPFVTRAANMVCQRVDDRGRDFHLAPQPWWKDEVTLDYSPGYLTATDMNLYADPVSPWNSAPSALLGMQSEGSTHGRGAPAMGSYTTPPYQRDEIAGPASNHEHTYPRSDSLRNGNPVALPQPPADEVLTDHRLPYSDSQPDLVLWSRSRPDRHLITEQSQIPSVHADPMTGVQRPRQTNERATSASRVKKPTAQRRPTSTPGRSRQRRAASSAPKGDDGSAARAFICSFARYGCASTFLSKNEWKRHVTSQHLQLGFYRCDVGRCSAHFNPSNSRDLRSPIPSPRPRTTSPPPGQPNDFNRKDLFTQHQRRMHAPWLVAGRRRTPTDAEHAAFETSLEEVRRRCWHRLRQPPSQSLCGLCGETFWGEDSWDARMEHVGRHFERGEPEGLAEDMEDVALRKWGLREGILMLVDGKCWLASLLHRAVFSLIIINKAGGLIYQREFQASLRKLSTNDYLVLAGTFHGVHAITRSITPKLPLSASTSSPATSSPITGTPAASGYAYPNPGVPATGLEQLETDRFRLTCFQTVTGTKFLLFTDPMSGNVDTIVQKIYELYADYVMKNPFYQLEMPVRCEAFDRHLGAWLRGRT